MAARTAKAERTSAETQIRLSLNLDGEGKVHVDTGFGMLDHMLTLTFFWARMDLKLKCTGDMQVDAHHTTEDCALVDTGRLKQLLGERLRVDSRNVHAFIVGEHGDSELAVWSGANVSGVDLEHFCRLRGGVDKEELDSLYRAVRDSAYEIIRRKGATYYGIAMAVARIAECIVRDERAMLPVSVLLQGQYGLDGLCLSIPAIVGRNGVESVLEIPLDPGERQALLDSAARLKAVIRDAGL